MSSNAPTDDAAMVSNKDIHERIGDTEKKFRLLFNNPRDVIWLMEFETRKILYASREIKDILGYEPEELVGKTTQDICTPEAVEKIRPITEEEADNFKAGVQRTLRVNTDFVTKDGAVLTADVDYRLYDDGGKLKAIGILRSPRQESEISNLTGELEEQLRLVIEERDHLRWEVKILEGLLPICSSCKKIRDENGKWQLLEKYVSQHSEAEFTHSICPECKTKLYPNL